MQCNEFSFVSYRILFQHLPCSEKGNYTTDNISVNLNKREYFNLQSKCLDL